MIKLAVEWFTPKLHPTPQLGDKVRHADDRVVDRSCIDKQDYNPAYIVHRPPRKGVVVGTPESHKWDVPIGMVNVLWDDVATEGAVVIQHPLKHGNQGNVVVHPTLIPDYLLEVLTV